jgi:NAD-dependent SIR2 family protein deacetylase
MARKRINDFGGKSAAGNGKRSVLLTGHNLISMRCLSCNKLNYLGFLETQRASAPRCNACGGGLSEIEESHKRRTGCSYKKAEKVAAANLGEKPFSCDTCKTKFRSAVALSLHVKEKHPDSAPVDVRQMELDHGFRRRHTL